LVTAQLGFALFLATFCSTAGLANIASSIATFCFDFFTWIMRVVILAATLRALGQIKAQVGRNILRDATHAAQVRRSKMSRHKQMIIISAIAKNAAACLNTCHRITAEL
jgi:hypothetical protein